MAILLRTRDASTWRFYKSESARKSALTQMMRHGRYNYFVCYLDFKGPAIHAARTSWVKQGTVYMDR